MNGLHRNMKLTPDPGIWKRPQQGSFSCSFHFEAVSFFSETYWDTPAELLLNCTRFKQTQESAISVVDDGQEQKANTPKLYLGSEDVLLFDHLVQFTLQLLLLSLHFVVLFLVLLLGFLQPNEKRSNPSSSILTGPPVLLRFWEWKFGA